MSDHSQWRADLITQWKNPQDIFSLLLIIGGDIVQKAMAQLAGNHSHFPAPVPFSFGCVAYAYNSVTMVMGEGRLMPATADYASIVVNAKSGIIRSNNSWVLGRLLRDIEPEVEHALKVEVYSVKAHGKWPLYLDLVWWSGLLTILVQLALASISAGVYGDWTNFIITGIGTSLTLLSSLLPQWKDEKWACRRLKQRKSKTVCITKGNGSQYVLVIVSDNEAYDLEDLASGRSHPSPLSKVSIIVLALSWIVLLITATCPKDHSWYLIGIGLLGMMQNLYAAGAKRKPSTHCIPLEHEQTFAAMKVMQTLEQVDDIYPGAGRCLLPIFFQQGLRPDEQARWDQRSKFFVFGFCNSNCFSCCAQALFKH